jgi:hypothetical protein
VLRESMHARASLVTVSGIVLIPVSTLKD